MEKLDADSVNSASNIDLTLLALLALSFTSCTIEKAPTVPETPAAGRVFITAEDPYDHPLVGGAIYLDGGLQAETTPDTVVAESGEHWVKVEFQNFFADSNQVMVVADSLVHTALVLAPLNPDVGSAVVGTSDSASGIGLIGAEIFLDGASTGMLTPDTLPNIPVGAHLIGAGLLGYDYRETQADIAAGLETPAALLLPSVSWNGIRIVTNADPAWVCVDERLLDGATPWIVAGFPDGPHSFSCFQEGYATVHDATSPALQTAQLFQYGHTEITFNLELWAAGSGYQEGKLAPTFELESDAEDTIALGGLRGRVVLVSFWFRDCPPCMQEMPYIQQVYSELGGQGFRVLAINPMFIDNLQDLIEVRANLNLTFELLMDQPGFAVTLAYGANQFPTNCLVDQRGVVDWYTGSLEYAELRARVEQLLNQ